MSVHIPFNLPPLRTQVYTPTVKASCLHIPRHTIPCIKHCARRNACAIDSTNHPEAIELQTASRTHTHTHPGAYDIRPFNCATHTYTHTFSSARRVPQIDECKRAGFFLIEIVETNHLDLSRVHTRKKVESCVSVC